jgi:predicted ArsR family transcriptional regulator
MLPKSILFYWSKGATTRRKMLKLVAMLEDKNKPCFLNLIAKKLHITHVAAKKHIDLLIEEGYLKQINPHGKPIYLKLTKKGRDTVKEL